MPTNKIKYKQMASPRPDLRFSESSLFHSSYVVLIPSSVCRVIIYKFLIAERQFTRIYVCL